MATFTTLVFQVVDQIKMIAKDVQDRVQRDYEEVEAKEIIETLNELCEIGFNVSPHQVCRSAIYVADGSYSKFLNVALPMLKSDPRDIIDEAERIAGGPGHFFSIPFPEIDIFYDRLYEGEEEPPVDFWQE